MDNRVLRIAFAAAAVAAALVCGNADAQEEDAHAFCALEFKPQSAEHGLCVSKQMLSAEGVARYLAWTETAPAGEAERVADVIAFCRERWAPDLYLIENCIRARAMIPPP